MNYCIIEFVIILIYAGEYTLKTDNRTGFVGSSLILSSFDRFTAWLYSLLKKGVFGKIFTSYIEPESSLIRKKRSKLSTALSGRIENSLFLTLLRRAAHYLLGCRLKVIGTFILSFGAYAFIVELILALLSNTASGLWHNIDIITSILIISSAFPLLLSDLSFAESLESSVIGRFIIRFTGWDPASLPEFRSNLGHIKISCILGIVCGAFTYYISPIYYILAAAAVIGAAVIIRRPELGVILLFAVIPWLPTMLIAGLVIFTAFAYLIKLIRRQRLIRFEAADIMVCAFAVMTASGGVITLSPESLKPSLLMVCLIAGYFLTVNLMTSRAWLRRCACTAVVSGVLESLYSIVLYLTGGGYSSDAWLDDEMFSSLGGRAVGTLDNPNMLGEYLIFLIPVAFALFLSREEGMKSLSALFSCFVMGACLILTWSRGAWLGLMAGLLIFLLMWHHRSLWLILAGIASIPVLPSVLPASVVSRFTSIGNMSDSSTSYRVYIWRATVNMIADNPLSGIGAGEGAWKRMYPFYTYNGIEAAPHSHNLYLQIWLELGVFGLIIFLAFLFLLYQSGFSMFVRTGKGNINSLPDIDKKRSIVLMRLTAAGPLCGIIAVLVQGLTDYSWYNYRLFLMFWLMCGLASAYIRSSKSMIIDGIRTEQDETSAEITINL